MPPGLTVVFADETLLVFDKPAGLLAVPVGVLEFAATLLGKRAAVERLTGSLWLDSSLIRARLGWTPPFTLGQGLDATVGALKRA